jgi:hypothetical protein
MPATPLTAKAAATDVKKPHIGSKAFDQGKFEAEQKTAQSWLEGVTSNMVGLYFKYNSFEIWILICRIQGMTAMRYLPGYACQTHKLAPTMDGRVQTFIANLTQKYPAHSRYWEIAIKLYYQILSCILKQHHDRLKLAEETVSALPSDVA